MGSMCFLLKAASCVSPHDVPAYSFHLIFSFWELFPSCNHFAILFPLHIIKSFRDENVELLVNIVKAVSLGIGTFL